MPLRAHSPRAESARIVVEVTSSGIDQVGTFTVTLPTAPAVVPDHCGS